MQSTWCNQCRTLCRVLHVVWGARPIRWRGNWAQPSHRLWLSLERSGLSARYREGPFQASEALLDPSSIRRGLEGRLGVIQVLLGYLLDPLGNVVSLPWVVQAVSWAVLGLSSGTVGIMRGRSQVLSRAVLVLSVCTLHGASLGPPGGLWEASW